MLDRLTQLIKIVAILSSIATLWLWIASVWLNVIAYLRSGGDLLPGYYLYFIILPVLYLIFMIISCTKLLPLRQLIITGVIMHVALAIWILVDVTHPSFVTKQSTGTAVVFALVWGFLSFSRIKLESFEKK